MIYASAMINVIWGIYVLDEDYPVSTINNAGPLSATLAQHWSNIGSAHYDYCVNQEVYIRPPNMRS